MIQKLKMSVFYILIPIFVVVFCIGMFIHGIGCLLCSLGHLLMTNKHTAREYLKEIIKPTILFIDRGIK